MNKDQAIEIAQYFDQLIETRIGKMSELDKASIKYFLETGTISGGFRNELSMMLHLLTIRLRTKHVKDVYEYGRIVSELRDIIYDLIDRPSDKITLAATELLIKSKPFELPEQE